MKADQFAQARFEVPILEDANSVQVALMQVMESLAWGRMDHKTAGLMLYALQTASINLRKTDFEVADATDVVIDRDDVHRTALGGPQWFEEDFEDEDEDEADGEEAQPGEQLDAKAAPEEASAVKPPSIPEAREQVQALIRNWVLETVAEKEGAKPS
ncbi:MAG: hypothetical protein WB562_10895 [Candidatus Sulfotelmatobacter sp.]